MISASIVLFKTSKKDIDTVIASYRPGTERKLYIIDNSPYVTEYCKCMESEDIIYVWNERNMGYGFAHNIGIRKAIDIGAKYHIVLNPDIQFEPEVLDELAEYMEGHEDTVYILPKVVYPDGELQYLCKLLPTPLDLFFRRFLPPIRPIKKMNDRYILKDSGYSRIMNPPCLSGCFMFMRVSTIKSHNLKFDEQFFMYCEDFDFIRRLHRIGKTIYYPEVSIVHAHVRESYRNAKMLGVHIVSACRYFNKYGWFWDKERHEMNKKILRELRN